MPRVLSQILALLRSLQDSGSIVAWQHYLPGPGGRFMSSSTTLGTFRGSASGSMPTSSGTGCWKRTLLVLPCSPRTCSVIPTIQVPAGRFILHCPLTSWEHRWQRCGSGKSRSEERRVGNECRCGGWRACEERNDNTRDSLSCPYDELH